MFPNNKNPSSTRTSVENSEDKKTTTTTDAAAAQKQPLTGSPMMSTMAESSGTTNVEYSVHPSGSRGGNDYAVYSTTDGGGGGRHPNHRPPSMFYDANTGITYTAVTDGYSSSQHAQQHATQPSQLYRQQPIPVFRPSSTSAPPPPPDHPHHQQPIRSSSSLYSSSSSHRPTEDWIDLDDVGITAHPPPPLSRYQRHHHSSSDAAAAASTSYMYDGGGDADAGSGGGMDGDGGGGGGGSSSSSYQGDMMNTAEDGQQQEQSFETMEMEDNTNTNSSRHHRATYPSSSSSFVPGQEEEDDRSRPMKRVRPSSSIGEHRLKIRFENLGRLGEIKQTYGRRDGVIPDLLCGTNEVYNERWRFEIRHHRRGGRVTIEWIITNLASKKQLSRRETLEESIIRESQGKTICNQVLKQALEERANELEQELHQAQAEGNATRVSNLSSRVRALRPKRCLIGLLFFGLQHQCIQQHIAMLEATGQQPPPLLLGMPLSSASSSSANMNQEDGRSMEVAREDDQHGGEEDPQQQQQWQ